MAVTVATKKAVIERDGSTFSNRYSIEWKRPRRVRKHSSRGLTQAIDLTDWRADMDSIRECSVEECDRKRFGHGYCQKHYSRWNAHGDPLRVRNGSTKERLARLSVDDGDCRVWIGSINRYGYGRITMRPHNVLTAHRVAWEEAHGPIPAGTIVRHKCDNPPCINPDHLELGTTAENMRDKAERGRSAPAQGSQNNLAKLTESDVPKIRAMVRGGASQAATANVFGVSQGSISNVIRGVTWTHVAETNI